MIETELMNAALELARQAITTGDVPVGAIVINAAGEIVGRGNNLREFDDDPTAHAEIVAMREAALVAENWRLDDHTLVVTLEPCAMCAGAISHARIARLYYAAADPKGGGVAHGSHVFSHPTCHHAPEVYAGIGEEEASTQLRDFFAARRG